VPVIRRFAALTIWLLVGCESSGVGSGQSAGGSRLATVTLPPDLDRVLRDYETAWRAGNAAELSSLFAEDGLVLPLGDPPAQGRPAIARVYGTPSGDLNLAPIAFAAGDTVAYIIGTFGGADISSHTAKFILALKRAPSGPWLIAADMGQQ
jgi:ketosteroid isomerase-like protein